MHTTRYFTQSFASNSQLNSVGQRFHFGKRIPSSSALLHTIRKYDLIIPTIPCNVTIPCKVLKSTLGHIRQTSNCWCRMDVLMHIIKSKVKSCMISSNHRMDVFKFSLCCCFCFVSAKNYRRTCIKFSNQIQLFRFAATVTAIIGVGYIFLQRIPGFFRGPFILSTRQLSFSKRSGDTITL